VFKFLIQTSIQVIRYIYVCMGEVPLRDTHRRTGQNSVGVYHWHRERTKGRKNKGSIE
jgi:hypothetical protein